MEVIGPPSLRLLLLPQLSLPVLLQRLHPLPSPRLLPTYSTTCSAQHLLPPHQHLLMRGAPLPPSLPQGSLLLPICLVTYSEQRLRMLLQLRR